MSDLISVIVPVYKVEKYLNQCVESIIAQTYRNLEIILVDDGSNDRCPEMCDKWAKQDDRIRVIHKSNGGLSDARNAGLLEAKGVYIGFVDGDDWIHPNMYSELYYQMKKNNADIAACGVEMVWENTNRRKMLTNSGGYLLDTTEAIMEIISEDKLKQPVWYKLYRREQIQDILFSVGKTHEDVFWSYQVIGRAKRVVVFDDAYYYYRQRDDSIMGIEYSLKRLDSLEGKELRQKYIRDKFPALEREAKINLYFSCVYHQQMVLKYLQKEQVNSATKKILAVCNRNSLKIKDIAKMSKTQIVWSLILKVNFVNGCKLRNRLRIGF